jgi:hypothetical protein
MRAYLDQPLNNDLQSHLCTALKGIQSAASLLFSVVWLQNFLISISCSIMYTKKEILQHISWNSCYSFSPDVCGLWKHSVSWLAIADIALRFAPSSVFRCHNLSIIDSSTKIWQFLLEWTSLLTREVYSVLLTMKFTPSLWHGCSSKFQILIVSELQSTVPKITPKINSEL